jgi:hypothetical protein
MSTAAISGVTVLECRVHLPRWGLWFAEVVTDQPAELSGQVTLTVADLNLRGTIVAGGPWLGRSAYRIVGGAGGWAKRIPSKGYASDAGVKASTVIGDAAREAGETVEGAPKTSLGPAWERMAGAASLTLQLCTERAWYVGEDGVTRFGARPRQQYAGGAARGSVDLAAGTIELMSDSIASLVPGVVVEGVEALDVLHELHGAKLRTTIWGSALSGTSKRLEGWRKLFAQLDPRAQYRGAWEYRVVSQFGKRVDLQPARSSLGLSDLRNVRMRPGVSGAKSMVRLGELVLVAFVNADPSRPVVLSHEDADGSGFTPFSTTLDVSLELKLGGDLAVQPVARMGDTCLVLGCLPGVINQGSLKVKAE